jgi:uncharacterized protein (TIGR02594 family)
MEPSKREEILLVALDHIGVKEITGKGANPQIVEYLETVDMPSDDEIPWCAAFINWVLKQVGIEGTGEALARSFLKWGESVIDYPEPGDIVILRRGTSGWQGHVGVYLDRNNGVVLVAGGNQYNRVGVNGYSSSRVIDIRRHKEMA